MVIRVSGHPTIEGRRNSVTTFTGVYELKAVYTERSDEGEGSGRELLEGRGGE